MAPFQLGMGIVYVSCFTSSVLLVLLTRRRWVGGCEYREVNRKYVSMSSYQK